MLEEVLKQINVNLERIADAMEKEAPAKTTKRKNKKEVEETKENTEVQETTSATIVQQQAPVQTTAIPVSTSPETYTQDEIARAMGAAMDAGKSDVVYGILRTFNANSLMDINPSNYSEIARILREAGIRI